MIFHFYVSFISDGGSGTALGPESNWYALQLIPCVDQQTGGRHQGWGAGNAQGGL